MYPVNPVMLIQMIKQGQNPQQLLMSILEGQAAGTNPINKNLINMVRQGNTADIEAFARNYFASQGKDFDSEFKCFKETYGLK